MAVIHLACVAPRCFRSKENMHDVPSLVFAFYPLEFFPKLGDHSLLPKMNGAKCILSREKINQDICLTIKDNQ